MRRLLLILAITLLSVSLRAEDSLYDPSTARRAPEELSSTFGVRSGAIRYDARMIRAAQIAVARAHRKTTWYCWRYVKDALVAANVIKSRPQTAWAKEAGNELVSRYGFRKIRTMDPNKAPIGAVIVYGGKDAGHVEIRTKDGFVSDFVSRTPYPRPVIGIYVKPV